MVEGKDYLVGVYYFSGWWRDLPNKYVVRDRDWRTVYPERIPLLGEYNDQETMDCEIVAAADHGVDYFQILWYPPTEADPSHPKLNAGLAQFMASPNSGRMRFTMEYTNHPPFVISTEPDWLRTCEYWCSVMAHPSYLRIEGRPVFKIHGLFHFLLQNDGDTRMVAKRIEQLRGVAEKNGLGNPLISGGVVIGDLPKGAEIAPYDFITTYMDMPLLPKEDEPYHYSRLINHAEDGWIFYGEKSEKPYVPYVPSGWDPRPWFDPRPAFDLPNREQWTDALRRVKAALDSEPNLGIPTSTGVAKTMLIYAWNEFGEGGLVAPTQGEGYMKLEAIREVFGR